MSDGKLLPPVVPPEGRAIRGWVETMNAGDRMFRAGLRADYGEGGMIEAYRRIRARELAEHDRHFEKFVAELARRSKR